MTRSKLLVAYWTAILVIPIVLFIGSIRGQVRQARAADVSARPAQPAPIRATMSGLHAHGGVPRGWKFLMPPGDAAEGRKVFVWLECFACHEVKGESFPQTSKTPPGTGPELTGMGGITPRSTLPNRLSIPIG